LLLYCRSFTNCSFTGFGTSATSTPFGQNKTGFGATTTAGGGGLFGGGGTATAGSGFGGFGGGTTSAFGGGAATGTGGSGGLFGSAAKPFGGTSTTGGTTLFGSGTGFGAGASTSTPAFGAGASTSFGGSLPQNNGTASTPFAEHVEKDPASANTQNRYQTISTMQPYQGFSLEELRLADYSQGRKQGNSNGQAGAFGTSSGFGGFGSGATGSTGFGGTSAAGGMFGGTTGTTSSPFGQQQQSTGTGFGSGTNSLFGAKPAATGGGLFGSTATTSGQTSGGMFGTSAPAFGGGATGGFGSGAATGATGGGLFGATPAKPAFGGFGSGATTGAGFGASTGTGFGASATPATGGTSLFGSGAAPATGGFGSQQPATSTPFSFSQPQQNQQQGQTGGSLFGGGFGGAQNQQQKPGGLFGNTGTSTTTGGLFGSQPAQQPAAGGGLFGATNNQQQQQTGGLFGNKPASTGGLFGSLGGSTGGGLFGNNNQTQQPAAGGLFGASNQQQGGGLFGSKPAATGLGSSLFGQSGQQQGSSLFGNSQQQQQPQLGNSLFGSTQNQQQQQQQQSQQLHTSLNQNPYGNDQLFANLNTPSQSVGPLATPLSASQKSKKQAIIPAYRLNPSASARLLTPQKRPAGYGFSYSTYGTPGSAMSNASPVGLGYSTNLGVSGLGRSLNKSLSTSNLRNSFSAEDSILMPGAFSTTARSGASSLKKLNINRNLNVRRPLFGAEAPDYGSSPAVRKSVSFDSSVANGSATRNGPSTSNSSNALVRTESPEPETSQARPAINGTVGVPEMQQAPGASRGKELATLHENEVPPSGTAPAHFRSGVPINQKDKEAGDYWMEPSQEEIEKMSAKQKERVKNFTVGRHGCGQVTFSTADLTTVRPDEICGRLVVFGTRTVTVYGENTPVDKPARGHGFNVPSVIVLENSWPRAGGGKLPVHEIKGQRFDKHLARLKRLKDTEFISYDSQTGRWAFRVQHFTTYGLDYEDDESMIDNSGLSNAPGTPTPAKPSQQRLSHMSPPLHSDSSLPSPPESSPDDTFDFKKGKRTILPGQFDERDMYDEDMSDVEEEMDETNQSFLGERSVGSLSDDGDEAMSQLSESDSVEGQEMAGSFPAPISTTEQSLAKFTGHDEPTQRNSILKASQTAHPFGTPLKTGRLAFGGDWTEQLQRTASPKKQDRQALRANQPTTFTQPDNEYEPTPKVRGDKPITNSLDLMHSLYGDFGGGKASIRSKFGASSKGFEVRA
jgi:nuclear pore complex protein Nup98-Nup96